MADIQVADRALPLAGAFGGSSVARLVVAEPATRLSLRAGEDALQVLSGALELDLPRLPLSSAGGDGRYAFWLGPDEWLVVDEFGEDLVARLQSIDAAFSAVDISHRNVAVMIDGPGAAAALNIACPMDLRPETFAVGKVARTAFGKTEIILHRKDDNTFRVECWRSFAPYVFSLLDEGAKDAALRL